MGAKGEKPSLIAELVGAIAGMALTVLPCGFTVADQATSPDIGIARQPLIRAIKGLEKRLGFRTTHNFSHRSHKIAAYYRCYYTGKLELPESYEGLGLTEGSRNGCPVNTQQYDVFFYPIEALASGKTPVTASLENATTERLLVVVPHEDFHACTEIEKLPASLNEAASTLVGFLTASEVAREEFGPSSEVFRHLTEEVDLFLQKAQIVNRYHAKLSALFAAARSGALPTQAALARKEELFAHMQSECKAISPAPHSFNQCLAANNNAGLAFDATYTRYYPLMYAFYKAHQTGGADLKATIEALKQALNTWSESEAVRRVEDLSRKPATRASP
jgi:hypothetical protein